MCVTESSSIDMNYGIISPRITAGDFFLWKAFLFESSRTKRTWPDLKADRSDEDLENEFLLLQLKEWENPNIIVVFVIEEYLHVVKKQFFF